MVSVKELSLRDLMKSSRGNYGIAKTLQPRHCERLKASWQSTILESFADSESLKDSAESHCDSTVSISGFSLWIASAFCKASQRR